MNSGGLEARIVGERFKPGKKANQEIARLLNIPQDEAPDFCNDLAAAAECIEFEGRVPYLKPTLSKKHIVIFDHNGGVCVTAEFKKQSHAFAAALHFLLMDKISHN